MRNKTAGELAVPDIGHTVRFISDTGETIATELRQISHDGNDTSIMGLNLDYAETGIQENPWYELEHSTVVTINPDDV